MQIRADGTASEVFAENTAAVNERPPSTVHASKRRRGVEFENVIILAAIGGEDGYCEAAIILACARLRYISNKD